MFRKRHSTASPGPFLRGLANETRGADAGSPETPVLIQRLIILHDGLMPLPSSSKNRQSPKRRNPELSEDASLEEHGEFILYYYDHSLHFSQQGVRESSPISPSPSPTMGIQRKDSDASESSARREKQPPADHATEEAVRFAGTCRALRSLPLALQPDDLHDVANGSTAKKEDLSETDVVHLNNSTLVFIPLEMGGDVIAIAQIPRSANQRNLPRGSEPSSSRGFGADPSAIRESIRQIHAAFSLLKGGGIHRRLLRTKHLESSKDWVLEVIEDDEKDDECLDLSYSSNGSNKNLTKNSTVKEDSVWKTTDHEEDEPVGRRHPSKGGARRKKRLTASSSLMSSLTSTHGSQMNKHDAEDTICGDYRYGGMDELFSLRREHRKLSNQLQEDRPSTRFRGLQRSSRWASSSNAADLFNDIANDFGHNDAERRIENLLSLLPITKLREDLVTFYDGWLCRLQGVCEVMSGGVGRCVVDMVPFPIFRGIGSSSRDTGRGQHPPLSPSAFVCVAAAELMKSLMSGDVTNVERHHGRLFGMSMFYEDRLILSQISSKRKQGHEKMPPEIPYLLCQYFRSSHIMQKERDEREKNNRYAKPLIRWMSSLSMVAPNDDTMKEDIEPSYDDNDTSAAEDASFGYLSQPSSSKDGPLESLFVHNIKKHVWLPRVHLPSMSVVNIIDHDDETETYVAMFENQELSFLLFFEIPSKGDEGVLARMAEELQPKAAQSHAGNNKSVSDATQGFANLLSFLMDQLSEFCSTYSSHEADMAPVKDINNGIAFPGEPGMDIIYVDRDERSFVLLSQHDLSTDEFQQVASKSASVSSHSNGSKQKLGLFGIASKPKEKYEDISCSQFHYASVLDCRHKLAAHLPLDVMLAFDDMFNEIGCLLCRYNGTLNATSDGVDAHVNHDMYSKKSIELCTFLPQGWVYGRSCGTCELYILLDTSKFVTINDVQKAVTRVRERLFNDKIR